jgi:hypothetical protein
LVEVDIRHALFQEQGQQLYEANYLLMKYALLWSQTSKASGTKQSNNHQFSTNPL